MDCRTHRRAPADQPSKGPELKDSTRRTLRTIFQGVIGLAAGMPLIVEASGLAATGGVALALTVSAAVTRVMALPVVDSLLPSWLRK